MYWIFDNKGVTVDRYTLVNKDGDVYGFSIDPFHPTYGFGQFSHNISEFTKEGRNEFIASAKLNPECLGVQVKLKDLSPEAQKFVNQRR
jgi:hypothetical protein